MAESDRDETEEDQAGEGGADEAEGKPPFASGWRWPLIILVVGIIALGAFVTLATAPEELPLPPPPPPPPPAVIVPRG